MNCLACRGVKARPLRNVSVWRRLDRIASTSRARTSSRVVPSSGRSPRRPRRRSSCSRSFSACLSRVRIRACSSRARCRNRRRTYWERHSSFLFFSPYFFRSSFSALIRSASHGWEGRSNFARENFGSPIDSHLRFRLLLLFLLFLLRAGAGARGERVDDGSCAVQIRVRHAHDVPKIIFHALELLRPLRRLRLFLLLGILPRRPLGLLALRRGRRTFGFRAWLLLRHRWNPQMGRTSKLQELFKD